MADDLSKSAMETANYGGHGHSQGRQGPDGPSMPYNDMLMQDGATVAQVIYSGGDQKPDREPDADDYLVDLESSGDM